MHTNVELIELHSEPSTPSVPEFNHHLFLKDHGTAKEPIPGQQAEIRRERERIERVERDTARRERQRPRRAQISGRMNAVRHSSRVTFEHRDSTSRSSYFLPSCKAYALHMKNPEFTLGLDRYQFNALFVEGEKPTICPPSKPSPQHFTCLLRPQRWSRMALRL